MNKVLLFCFLNLAMVTSNGQKKVWFMGVSKDSARALCDSIVSLATTKYTFKDSSLSYFKDNCRSYGEASYRYVPSDTTNVTQYLTITFSVYNDGENKAYGKPGIPTYYFFRIGNIAFSDVFPFWQRFVDSAAIMRKVMYDVITIEPLVKETAGGAGKKFIFTEQSRSSLWELVVD